jgi:hypothetical protein
MNHEKGTETDPSRSFSTSARPATPRRGRDTTGKIHHPFNPGAD